MNRIALAIAYACVLLVLTASWILRANAQQTAGGQRIFTGTTTKLAPPNVSVSSGHYRFEPGARTWWHSHQYGQVMIVEQGRGRYQNQGEPITEFREGDSAYARPNVLHWHGAAPDEAMTQVSVAVGGATWAGEVSADEYLGKVKPPR